MSSSRSLSTQLYEINNAPHYVNGTTDYPPSWKLFGDWSYQELLPGRDTLYIDSDFDYVSALPQDSSEDNVSVQISFNGTGIAVLGSASCPTSPCVFSASLDGGSPQVIGPPVKQLGEDMVLFNASALADSSHTLALSDFTFEKVSLNFAIVTLGPTTDIASGVGGTHARWDDQAVVSAGGWEEVNGEIRPASAGSAIQFTYSGTDIAVVGSFDSSVSGEVTLLVSLDGLEPQTHTTNVTGDPTSGLFIYFKSTARSAGNDIHTIKVEVGEVTGSQVFSLQGFYYTPSFSSLEGVPELSLPSISTSTSAASAATTSSASAVGETSSLPPPSPPSHSSKGAAIGGAIGGVAFLFLVALAVWLLLRRRRRYLNAEDRPIQDTHPSPFIQATIPANRPTYWGKSPEIQSFAITHHGGTSSVNGFSDRQTESGTTSAGESERDRRMMDMMRNLQDRMDAIDRPPVYG